MSCSHINTTVKRWFKDSSELRLEQEFPAGERRRGNKQRTLGGMKPDRRYSQGVDISRQSFQIQDLDTTVTVLLRQRQRTNRKPTSQSGVWRCSEYIYIYIYSSKLHSHSWTEKQCPPIGLVFMSFGLLPPAGALCWPKSVAQL